MRVAPPGWHTVTPRLFVSDPKSAVSFLRKTFRATGRYQATRPSELRIGDSIVMVSGDEFRGAMPACLYVYVDDVDATCKRALRAGATCVEAPTVMPWGDRRCIVTDPWDNLWQIATRKRLL